MAGGEFELIDRYFDALGAKRGDVDLAVGDDGALVDAGGAPLAAAVGVACGDARFAEAPERTADALTAEAVGELEARGATPRWALLTVSLPRVDADWLDGFAPALGRALAARGVALVGGDTTRGPFFATLFLYGTLDSHAGTPAPTPR